MFSRNTQGSFTFAINRGHIFLIGFQNGDYRMVILAMRLKFYEIVAFKNASTFEKDILNLETNLSIAAHSSIY